MVKRALALALAALALRTAPAGAHALLKATTPERGARLDAAPAQGIVEVRTPANLVETAFGRAVLVKIVLFAAIVALGLVNRRRMLPGLQRAAHGDEAPGRAGCGARCAPSSYSASRSWRPPARSPATNVIHIYLFDRRDGRQYDERKELTVSAELQGKVEPIDLEATKAGPGHYVISGAALGVEGDWTVEIAARVTDFDEFRTELAVPVR